MRIETHEGTISFDGGTMSRKEAMQFALDLANAAWVHASDDRESRLAFTTVGAAAAMKEIHGAIYVYGDGLGNPDVNALIHDRQIDRMTRRKSQSVTATEARHAI